MAWNTIRDLSWVDGIRRKICAAPTALIMAGGNLRTSTETDAKIQGTPVRISINGFPAFNAEGVAEASPACQRWGTFESAIIDSKFHFASVNVIERENIPSVPG